MNIIWSLLKKYWQSDRLQDGQNNRKNNNKTLTFNVNCKCREMCQKPTKKYFFYYATSSLHSCIVKFDAKINSEWVTNKQNHREASLSKRHTTYEKSWRCTWSSSWERASGSDSAVSRVLAMIFATGRGFTPPCNDKSIKNFADF